MAGGYPSLKKPSSQGSQRNGQEVKPKPLPPKRPIFVTFTDISEADLAKAAVATSKAEVKQILKDCMKIDQSEGFRTEILADLHYQHYAFCMSKDFSADKTSTLLSIMKIVLEEAVCRRLDCEAAFDEFKNLVLKHGVQRPPYSVGVFTFDDAKAITDYVYLTFFRHYRLYMYVYMAKIDLTFHNCMTSRLGVACPPLKPKRMSIDCEVDPKQQPELAELFKPSDEEQAEAKLREARRDDEKEDRAALIKRKVDEGVQKLMEKFESNLKEQDVRYASLMDEVAHK